MFLGTDDGSIGHQAPGNSYATENALEHKQTPSRLTLLNPGSKT